MKKGQNRGFDTRDIDRTVRPQNDFYRYANGGWLRRNKLPKTESRWGTFTKLRYDTERKLRAILTSLPHRAAVGTPARMIRDFYASGMHMKHRNRCGLSPLSTLLARIDAIETREELLSVITKLHRIGCHVPFGVSLDQDAKQSTRYALYLHQDGLGMPDRDYYLKEDTESIRVKSSYIPYVRKLLSLSGREKADADVVLRIETMLARASMDKVTRREIEKTYHKKTLGALSRLAPTVNWRRYFKDIGAGTPRSVVVMQPIFFSTLGTMLERVPLSDWKIYLAFHLINDFAGALSQPFVRHRFSFYGTTLAGVKTMKPLWRVVLAATNASLGELFGQLYVQRHFPKAWKHKANALVKDLCAVYESRIRALDWMGPETKRRAIAKLRAMRPKIGYPSRWKGYRGLSVRPDDFVGNLMRSAEYEHRRALRKLSKRVNRDEWYCLPQVVNAFYNPSMNDMLFPAAILQPPFFDPRADDAVNYGAIGSVIGHEMTHGFDDEGAKFDASGNLRRWWTKADQKRFERKGRQLVQQFNAYHVSDRVPVNGKLTLGENIADLGGVMIALDAYQRRLLKTGRATIGGCTPEQRFFLSFAKFECEHIRPEYEKMLALNDTHAPGKFRINGPLSNMEEFYGAFKVTKRDLLYRAASDRVKIW